MVGVYKCLWTSLKHDESVNILTVVSLHLSINIQICKIQDDHRHMVCQLVILCEFVGRNLCEFVE